MDRIKKIKFKRLKWDLIKLKKIFYKLTYFFKLPKQLIRY